MTIVRRSPRPGFTLIELLVVISIIALLSTSLLVELDARRKDARDAKRLGDITTLVMAMNLFYHDLDRFPGVTTTLSCREDSPCVSEPTFWLEGSMKKYLSPFPVNDPGNHRDQNADKYLYVNEFTTTADTGMALYFCLERGPQQNDCQLETPGDFEQYCGGEDWSTRCIQ